MYLRRIRRWFLPSALIIAGSPTLAPASDIFNTQSGISAGAADPLLGTGVCHQKQLSSPLSLYEAIERSLCESPKTRSAWEAVKQAAAQMGESKSAYLPTIDGSVGYSYERSVNDVSGSHVFNSNYSQGVYVESLSLSWTLYDFGSRAASVRSSRQLMTAAQANQNSILQGVFADAARDYYAAQAASAKTAAARRIEDAAKQILAAASARFSSGVVPITDKLQANTAYAQAVFERAAAEGSYRRALGTLAVDMNLAPDQPVTLPDLDQGVLPDVEFVHAVHDLMADAAKTHPTILAAKAQLESALADIDVARAEGLPKVKVGGGLSKSNQALSTTAGVPGLPGSSSDRSIGVSIEFPLFEGFSRLYKVREAEAAANLRVEALHDAQNQVALGVWTNYQALETGTENLRNTEVILASAREAFEAARQRYTHGAGNILELLTGQNTLALAEVQRIQAHSDWRTARLQLAESLGNLGLWALQ